MLLKPYAAMRIVFKGKIYISIQFWQFFFKCGTQIDPKFKYKNSQIDDIFGKKKSVKCAGVQILGAWVLEKVQSDFDNFWT